MKKQKTKTVKKELVPSANPIDGVKVTDRKFENDLEVINRAEKYAAIVLKTTNQGYRRNRR